MLLYEKDINCQGNKISEMTKANNKPEILSTTDIALPQK